MLLHASSNLAALEVVRALRADHIEAGWDDPGDGTHAVWVWVPAPREPEVLKIAVTVDPRIEKPDALDDQDSTTPTDDAPGSWITPGYVVGQGARRPRPSW